MAAARRSDETSGGLPKNFMRACLLLLLAEEPAHGYDLLVRLEQFGIRGNDPGGLYRSLRAMEQEGLVESRWQTSDMGPRRRMYRLTEEGTEWLHAWAGTLRESRRIVGSYLERYEVLFSRPPSDRLGARR